MTEYNRHIQAYLDNPGLGYLNAINGTTFKSLIARADEMTRLKIHLPTPQRLLSIGVGQGEEIHALHVLYGGRVKTIFGLDMSYIANSAASERTKEYRLPARFIVGNATNIPLATSSFDGVILSSLMHEVYSYAPDGKEAWNNALREASRVLNDGGCILLRDSAAPELTENIALILKTPLANAFYDYFRREYRTFNGWEESLKAKFARRSNLPPLPKRTHEAITLTPGQAAELLFHFVNFEMGYPNSPYDLLKNNQWKELNEIYYVPKSNAPYPMTIDEYTEEVINQANEELRSSGYQLICVVKEKSVRPRMPKPIHEHFVLGTAHIHKQLLPEFVQKMELVFQKVQI